MSKRGSFLVLLGRARLNRRESSPRGEARLCLLATELSDSEGQAPRRVVVVAAIVLRPELVNTGTGDAERVKMDAPGGKSRLHGASVGNAERVKLDAPGG